MMDLEDQLDRVLRKADFADKRADARRAHRNGKCPKCGLGVELNIFTGDVLCRERCGWKVRNVF